MQTPLDSACASFKAQLNQTSESGSLKIEWLDSKEAANHLRISNKTLLNLTSTGVVPYHKFGRLNRYRKDELDNLLLQNKRGKNGN